MELNSKYPGILPEEKVAKAIMMYQNSDKDYNEIVSEIETIKEQMIKEYIAKEAKKTKIWYYSNAEADDRESRTFSQIKQVWQLSMMMI